MILIFANFFHVASGMCISLPQVAGRFFLFYFLTSTVACQTLLRGSLQGTLFDSSKTDRPRRPADQGKERTMLVVLSKRLKTMNLLHKSQFS